MYDLFCNYTPFYYFSGTAEQVASTSVSDDHQTVWNLDAIKSEVEQTLLSDASLRSASQVVLQEISLEVIIELVYNFNKSLMNVLRNDTNNALVSDWSSFSLSFPVCFLLGSFIVSHFVIDATFLPLTVLASVVETLDSAFHRRNRYPVDKC